VPESALSRSRRPRTAPDLHHGALAEWLCAPSARVAAETAASALYLVRLALLAPTLRRVCHPKSTPAFHQLNEAVAKVLIDAKIDPDHPTRGDRLAILRRAEEDD
jgi:hypothetical protein